MAKVETVGDDAITPSPIKGAKRTRELTGELAPARKVLVPVSATASACCSQGVQLILQSTELPPIRLLCRLLSCSSTMTTNLLEAVQV